MSRSYRKTPVRGVTTAPSDKEDKQRAHRALRRAERRAIARDDPGPRLKDVSDPWSFAKDGKTRLRDRDRASARPADVRRRLKK